MDRCVFKGPVLELSTFLVGSHPVKQGASRPLADGARVAEAHKRTASRLTAVATRSEPSAKGERQELILDAVLRLLAEHGIAGVSHRSVAREAGVAHGLVGYYYEGKVGLIAAALRRIGAQDIAMIDPDPAMAAMDRLKVALRRVADPELLTTEYLSLRLQLWSLANADEEFEQINAEAQGRYRKGLADLVRAARPDLPWAECRRRAADINVVQNGLWLTVLLGLDRASVSRAVTRCEEIALGE